MEKAVDSNYNFQLLRSHWVYDGNGFQLPYKLY